MRLSAKAIKNYANINNFSYDDQWIHRAGDANTFYFQLVDLDKDSLRYLLGITDVSSIDVTFPSIDDTTEITLSATQADSNDKSIWKIDISSSQIPNSGNVVFTVTEGAVVKKFSVLAMVSVEFPGNDGSC